jgi:hypothetical protein
MPDLKPNELKAPRKLKDAPSSSTSTSVSTSSYVEPLNPQQIRIYRRMTGEQRFRIGFEIADFVNRLALAGIRHRHPEASDAEAQRLLREISWK